jgi:hypothetical protein
MALQTIPRLTAKAQQIFNRYIRTRDEGLPCISCGSNNGNQAGHYFSVKGFSALRFNEFNVHLQCPACNMYKYGNLAMYRIGLVDRIGHKAILELENEAINKRIKKWDRTELNDIIQKYQQ